MLRNAIAARAGVADWQADTHRRPHPACTFRVRTDRDRAAFPAFSADYCSDGIGAAAARTLTAKGEKVVIVGRSAAKTAAVAQALNAPYHVADFADLAQVRDLAGKLQAAYPRIDVLANNAGGIMGTRELTVDGFEKTFQVNHLAQFLLTSLLMPTLIASNAKVLQTASVAAQRYGRIDIDDLVDRVDC